MLENCLAQNWATTLSLKTFCPSPKLLALWLLITKYNECGLRGQSRTKNNLYRRHTFL